MISAKPIYYSILFLFASLNVFSQEITEIWTDLADISYKEEFSEILGFDIEVPVFGQKPKALEGKSITIRGYVVPLEGFGAHKEFILSSLPYNMCYFCGGAGPETVMEVYAVENIPYSAKPITLKGTLTLNDDDVNRLMYLLTDARLVSVP